MSQTYRATVEDDRIRWHDAEHPDSRRGPVEVQVVVLDEPGEDSLIERTPGVCGGDACCAGTRIPVWMVVDAWAGGWSEWVDFPRDAGRVSTSRERDDRPATGGIRGRG